MRLRRSISPVSFESLLLDPSDAVASSDSEDELDEASRTAKRRRVEHLAQDYLKGRPLFILSASLKGPLGNGWVNPWSETKTKPQRERSYECPPANKHSSSKDIPKASVVPETGSEYSRDDITSRASTEPSRSATPKPKPFLASYSKLFHSNEPATKSTGSTQGLTSEDLENGRRSVSQVSSETISRGAQLSNKQVQDMPCENSENSWLRKSRKRSFYRGIDSRIPSPSPSTRPPRPQESNKAPRLSHAESPGYADGPDTIPRIHGFTAVNRPAPTFTVDAPRVDQPSLPIVTNSIKRSSQHRISPTFRKNVSQTGPKTQSTASNPVRSRPENAQQPDQPLKELATVKDPTIKGRKSASISPSMTLLEHPFITVSKPFASSQAENRARKAITERPPDPAEDKKTQEMGTSFHDSTIPSPTPKEADAGCSAATESDHITSAQIVPDYYRSETHITPLNSLEFLTTNGQNTHQDQDVQNSDSHTLGNHAQVTAPRARKLAVGEGQLSSPGVARPGIRPHKGPRRAQSMPLSRYSQIKSFHSFHEEVGETSETKALGEEEKVCHEASDIATAHDLGTSKRIRFNHQPFSTSSTSKTRAASPDKIRLDRKRSSPASRASPIPHSTNFKKAKRVASLPSLSTNSSTRLSQSTGSFKLSPQEIMSILQRGGPSDVNSPTGTPLAFTLSGSTESVKQDGQGALIKLRNFENFDLKKAIEDAGSFLQSWDMEKDVQRLRNGEKLSATSEALREPTSSALEKRR